MQSAFRLDGRRAVITGGTQGIGAAIAISIAKAGGDVVLVGLKADDEARRTRSKCQSLGVQAEVITADLARPPDEYIDGLMADIDGAMLGIDLLVNNAGTFIDKPYLEMDWATYRTTFNVNVAAGYFLTQAFARRWVANGVSGRVVFTGSINGFLAEPDHTAYDASKGAVASMIRSLCVSLAPSEIRVNSIAPGLVRTPLTATAIDSNGLGDWMKLHTPSGEVPGPDVCGDVAVFLLSDAARHIHGQTLLVDGGMSVWQQPDPP